MEQNKEQGSQKTLIYTEEPELYDVIFLNDDFTTMDFVIEVLRNVFFIDATLAVAIMLDVHKKGASTVGTYTFDIALSKQQKATAMARQEGFPLRIKVEPHNKQI